MQHPATKGNAGILRIGIIAAAVGPPAAAVLFYWVDPSQPGTLPPLCMFHFLTGLHCPCCGSTRCSHALAHGDLVQAAAWNPLTLVFLCLFLPWLYWVVWRILRNRPIPSFNVPT